MGTKTRPELSGQNKWYIPKHRYYELKHFCLQYPEWLKMLEDLDGLPSHSPGVYERVNEGKVSDPTSAYAEARNYFTKRIEMINTAAYQAANHQFWYPFIVDAVTTGSSFDILEAQKGIMPVSRVEWYEIYRRFFWFLDKMRD